MANKIKGITIEIGGDVQPLNKALEDVNKKSRDLQSELREVERLLKLDPKNTELLAQKQKLLSDAVAETKEKLDILREAEKQVQQQFERGEIGEEQYRAIQREVIKTEQELKKLENQLRETNNKWKETAETLDRFGKKTTEIGKDMTTKVTAPIVGAAAASMVAWKEVDGALDTIVTKTGATGEAMEELEKSFRAVAKTMPTEIQSIGEAIGELNTQFGLTGTELEEVTAQLLKFAQINEANVTTSTQHVKEAIEAFGLSTNDLGLILDAVTKTAQDTGVATDKLFEAVVRGAPQLKSLGLDFAQATAIMGSFEQKGIDSSKALSYLSRAQVQFAKDGKTLADGLTELVTKLQNTADETEALNIASEVFGTKGATFMLDAIRRGALDFEDFANAAKLAAGAVTETYEGTLDPVDKFTVAFNNLKLVGSDIAALIQERLAPIIEKLVEKLQGAADWFRNLSPEMQNTILVIGGLVAAIGPLLIIVGKIASGISAIIGLFGGFSAAAGGAAAAAGGATAAAGGLSAVIGALTGPIGIAIAAIAAITAVIVHLWKTNEEFRENVKAIWEQIKELFTVAFEKIKSIIMTFYEGIKAWWEEHSATILEVLNALWNTIATIFNTALGVIRGLFDVFIGLFTGDWERMGDGVKKIFASLWEGIKNIVANAWNILKGAFSILWDSIAGWFNNLVSSAVNWGKNLISGFVDGIKSMIGKVKDAVSGVIGAVSDFLGFSSPAKKGEGRNIVKWGYNMIEGFMEGMQKALPELQMSARAIVPTIKNEIINTTQIDYSRIPKGDTIIHVYNPQPSPSELARQIKKTQQELALGF